MLPEAAMTPPLGLITVAALCPPEWTLRLLDHAFDEIRDEDLRWADLVMVSAMHAQRADAVDVCRRARAAGTRTFVGGPWASSDPEAVQLEADHVMVGEAEEVFAAIARELEQRNGASGLSRQRQAGHVAQPDSPFRPAAAEHVYLHAGAVLARMPVPVRVLRHHHDLRPQAAH